MKGNFFEQFKEYLLNVHKEKLGTFVPYYETLLQIKDNIQEILDDAEKYYLEITHNEDKYDGYTDGEFEFHFYEKPLNESYGWQSNIDHYYVMELLHDDRMWGYCECTPEHKGYNPKHNCCGNGCDWTAPMISIKKISEVAYHAFEGVARDMWELESKWNEEKVDHEKELRKAHLERIERQISELEEQKKNYLK